MRKQSVWNIISVLMYGLICGCIIYIPSERSFCCHGSEWRLGFLWLEAFLMSICFFYICFCLFFLWKNEASNRFKVLLSSKVLFELVILSLFLLCTVSNSSVLGGIDINDRDQFPATFVPNIIIRCLRVSVAVLLTAWIFVYDFNYLPLEGSYAKLIQLRRFIHGFVTAMTLFQAVRFGIIVFFWPHVMTNILEKTDHDELYLSITLPVSNMFWLRCFFKLWQSEPGGTYPKEPANQPINVHDEVADRMVAIILKQMNIRMGFTVVIAMSLVGIMYAIQLLDKSDHVSTGCSYGVFRVGLSTVIIVIIVATFARRMKGEIAVVEIHIHGVEMFQFILFFIAKISINILNGVWFSSDEHSEGSCKVPGISITAQVVDGIFNVLQFICLLRTSKNHWLLRSSLFYLIIGINCGLIWFDLSAEAIHLKHFSEDFDDLNKEWIFLLIQAIFWLGLEYHIIVVELLIMQRLENPFKRRVFNDPEPTQLSLLSRHFPNTIPPNFFKAKPKTPANPVKLTPLARSNSSTDELAQSGGNHMRTVDNH